MVPARGPTAPSSTPRTRPRNTRTSTRSTSRARTGGACGRRSTTSSGSGSTRACASSASTTRTPSRSPSGSGASASIKADHPEVIFLAEAFTRPKVMYRLAKLGFTPVVHVLHLAQHAGGAARVPDRADRAARSRVLPAELLAEHARHPARRTCRTAAARRSRRASSSPPRCPPTTASTARPSSCCEHDAARAGQRGVPRLGEVPDPRTGIWTAPESLAPLIARVNAHPPRPPGAADQRAARVPRHGRRAACSPTRKRTPDGERRHPDVVEPRSASCPHRGASSLPLRDLGLPDKRPFEADDLLTRAASSSGRAAQPGRARPRDLPGRTSFGCASRQDRARVRDVPVSL